MSVLMLNHNYLLITGSESENGLMYAFSEIHKAQTEPRSMPPLLLSLKDGVYSLFRPPAGSPLYPIVRDFELGYLHSAYGWQKRDLEGQFKQLIGGRSILDYSVATSDGVKRSYCVIGNGFLPALVPKVDVVFFAVSEDDLVPCPWERVNASVQNLLMETDFYPALASIDRFPVTKEIDLMRQLSQP